MIWILYILLCMIVGYFGRENRIGFWGTLAVSIILTPVVSGIGVLLFGNSKAEQSEE